MLNKIYIFLGVALAAVLAFLKAVSIGKKVERAKQIKAALKQKDKNIKAIIKTEKAYNEKVNSKPKRGFFTK